MVICERGFAAMLYPCVLTDWTLTHYGYGERYIKGSCEVTYESGRKVTFKRERAHVVALATKLGRPVRAGMQANHHCDNRACIQPEHLYEGTQRQNVQDMWDRKRARSPFTPGRPAANRKFSPEQRRAIQRRYAAGGISMKDLAAEYGACKATIYLALREAPEVFRRSTARNHSTQAQT